MVKKRLIPVLILRDGMIVQTLQFKFTNIIGDAITAVEFFNRWAADEIIILDVSRTAAKREKFYSVIQNLSRKCFVPLTVGGWIDSVEEVRRLTRYGADKVTVNTAAVRRPAFITECATVFGSQCIVAAIDARRRAAGDWEVVVDRGREPTGRPVLEWAQQCEAAGAGEIFLTSIDQDGTRRGYDLELMRAVVDAVTIPVIAFGGVLAWQDLVDGIKLGGCEAVSAANVFHYTEHSTRNAKEFMRRAGIDVR
jgi:cyclase